MVSRLSKRSVLPLTCQAYRSGSFSSLRRPNSSSVPATANGACTVTVQCSTGASQLFCSRRNERSPLSRAITVYVTSMVYVPGRSGSRIAASTVVPARVYAPCTATSVIWLLPPAYTSSSHR